MQEQEKSTQGQEDIIAAPHSQPSDLEKQEVNNESQAAAPPFSVHSEGKKIFIIMTVSFAALVSPLSSSIYWPAIPSLSKDLNVSISLVNLTVTTYLIFQGLAPSLVGTFSDIYGRRPAYLICFTVYLAANIGLSLQNSYPALMVLRCLQACGSSGTIAVGSAVAADMVTRAERGKYMGYASMGVTLGPALGPVIGGLLDGYLGWRAIFWFLVIFSACFLLIIASALPETCRAVVGNGSIRPAKWNRSLWQVIRDQRRRRKEADSAASATPTLSPSKKRPSPLAAARIVAEKQSGLILLYGALIFAGYMAVMSTLSSELESRFGFGAIQVGLCYLPLGLGSLTSRWTGGYLLDWNFRREAKRQGMIIVKNQQQDIRHFNIEVARLTITIPLIYSAALCLIAYGWVMQYRTALAGPLVMLFFTGHLTTAAFSSLSTVILDTHRQSAATATAANNLLRCLVGAGAVALSVPLIDRIGIGWTATFIAALWFVFSPCVWAVYLWGHKWRLESADPDA